MAGRGCGRNESSGVMGGSSPLESHRPMSKPSVLPTKEGDGYVSKKNK